ncbi:MAG TPA: sulfite oxidase-like oxidoreductase [Burkholderiales bacterium]
MLFSHRFVLGLFAAAPLFFLAAPAVQAQEAALRIEGIGDAPTTLTLADLRGMKRQAVEDKRAPRNGKGPETVVHYGGVLLADVLDRAGFNKLDPHMKRRAAVFAIASDNYEVAYSWGEIYNSAAGAHIVVLDEREGKPQDAAEGPLGLAAFDDRNPGPRHVKRLLVLRVMQGAKP